MSQIPRILTIEGPGGIPIEAVGPCRKGATSQHPGRCCFPCPAFYRADLCTTGACAVLAREVYVCVDAVCPGTGAPISPGTVIRGETSPFCYLVKAAPLYYAGKVPPGGQPLPPDATVVAPASCQPDCLPPHCAPVDGYLPLRPCGCAPTGEIPFAVISCTCLHQQYLTHLICPTWNVNGFCMQVNPNQPALPPGPGGGPPPGAIDACGTPAVEGCCSCCTGNRCWADPQVLGQAQIAGGVLHNSGFSRVCCCGANPFGTGGEGVNGSGSGFAETRWNQEGGPGGCLMARTYYTMTIVDGVVRLHVRSQTNTGFGTPGAEWCNGAYIEDEYDLPEYVMRCRPPIYPGGPTPVAIAPQSGTFSEVVFPDPPAIGEAFAHVTCRTVTQRGRLWVGPGSFDSRFEWTVTVDGGTADCASECDTAGWRLPRFPIIAPAGDGKVRIATGAETLALADGGCSACGDGRL